LGLESLFKINSETTLDLVVKYTITVEDKALGLKKEDQNSLIKWSIWIWFFWCCSRKHSKTILNFSGDRTNVPANFFAL